MRLKGKWKERKRLRSRKVDKIKSLNNIGKVVEEKMDSEMEMEIIRKLKEIIEDLIESIKRKRSIEEEMLIRIVWGEKERKRKVKKVGIVRIVDMEGIEIELEIMEKVGINKVDIVMSEKELGDKIIEIKMKSGIVRKNRIVNKRMGEGRIVELIVEEEEIEENIDEKRIVEGNEELGRKIGWKEKRLRVVEIEVEDRRLDNIRKIGRIRRRKREGRIGGEKDMVVDDEMKSKGKKV